MRVLRHSCKQKPEFLHCSLWWFKIILKSGVSRKAVYRLLGDWLRGTWRIARARLGGLKSVGACGVGGWGVPAHSATWAAAAWLALAEPPQRYRGTSVTSPGSLNRFSCSSTAVILDAGGRGRGGPFPLPLPSQKSNLWHQRMTRTKDFRFYPHRRGLQGSLAGEGEGHVLTFFWPWGILRL